MFQKVTSLILAGLLAVVLFLPTYAITASADEGDMKSADFKFNVNNLTPSEHKYAEGTRFNIQNMLVTIGQLLLVVIPLLAVLFIVVGGIMMATASLGGKDGQFSKGKTIITFNIIALVLSLSSYSIIQLITWVLK